MIGPRDLGHRLDEIERRLDDMRSSQLALSRIGAGGLEIADGGTIHLVDDNGDTVAELDKDSQTFYDTNGDPLAVFDGSGVAVGDDVKLDADGLKITDVLQEAIWIDEQYVDDGAAPLGQSEGEIIATTTSPPDWVDTLSVLVIVSLTSFNITTNPNQIVAFIRIEGVDSETFNSAGPGVSVGASLQRLSVPLVFSRTISDPDQSIAVSVRGSCFDEDPDISAHVGMSVLAIGRKT